tara:strand:- start:227 stop:487 length:261 start_codon:yes stop_codon:yes gene_type:complete
MKSIEIQAKVVDFVKAGSFSAPYGVLTSEGKSKAGRPYLSVTFGRARTLDATVEIYNKSFIVVRSSRTGSATYRNVDDLFVALNSL